MSEADRESDDATFEDAAAPTGDVAEPADATTADEEPAPEPEFDLQAIADADPRTKVELLGALIEAERERDEFLDDLRRAHADFENYRKRMMRDSASQREAGKASVTSSLLEVLDDLDRTLSAAEESSDTALAKGVELVATKLVTALQSDGLERIDATGVPFDPTEHEAVQQVEAEEPSEVPTVAQVLRPGYRLRDKTLRAAMVVVEQ